jgi:hypothetical protein
MFVKIYLKVALLGLLAQHSYSLPQLHFDGKTSADKDPADVKTRLGLVASVLGNHPTGDDLVTNSGLQQNPQGKENGQFTRNCCCVHVSRQCPNNRNNQLKPGNNGGFAGQPRVKGRTSDEQFDDGIAVRIVNDPSEFSQPQTQLEGHCEANEKSCCYDSSSELNNAVSQSRCITRSRPSNKNVRWDQKCSETEPRNIRQGEKRCGERRFREISGKQKGEANPGEFPWTCLVLNQDNDFIGSCAIVPDNRNNDVRGGTDRVVTAAHKLKKIKKLDEVKVRVIEYDASGFKGPENTKHKEYVVAEIVMHPDFDSVRLSHDLAVLKVETRRDAFGDIKGKIDLQHTDDVNAACVPGCSNQFGHQFSNGTGVRCWVAGWGKDGVDGQFQVVQNRVDVPLMDHNTCQTRMQKALGRQAGRNFRLSSSEVCAGGEEGKDACDGDGGAPLVCQSKDNRWHVVGLVTWGVDCARKGVPGIYANIYDMLNFIMSA